MHTDPAHHQCIYTYLWEFLTSYLSYLRSVKDIQESVGLIYLQQIRQYCDAVLSVLEDGLPNNWEAHFIYAYYHLLGPRLCQPSAPPRDTFEVRQFLSWDDGTFVGFVQHVSLRATVGPGSQSFDDDYLGDILEISNNLTKGAKREAIFALSASFCLAFLCDNRSTAPDTRRIFKASGIDQRRRREHPWRWRRMISRRHSLGNQPVIMQFGFGVGIYPKEWQERLSNMRKAFRDAGTYSDSVVEHKIYTIPEFLHINKHRRNMWLQQGFDIQREPIHIEQDLNLHEMLPARYQGRQEWPMYMLLLDLLPHILSSSGRYEPLVTMCRTKCLASLSRCWPKKSRRARQAIENYLQRMDLEKGHRFFNMAVCRSVLKRALSMARSVQPHMFFLLQFLILYWFIYFF
ncbi:hypothetical protein CPC08DRAFT_393611 [Agrocybe pediades]|nr:hypothetical protein CPC08DRAFT_393611 [Agrocybe pediades]